MYLRLLFDVPVSSDQGLVAGRVLEVSRTPTLPARREPRWYVRGDLGEEVGVLTSEAHVSSDEARLSVPTMPLCHCCGQEDDEPKARLVIEGGALTRDGYPYISFVCHDCLHIRDKKPYSEWFVPPDMLGDFYAGASAPVWPKAERVVA